MEIHGLQKLTLLDYPGHTACTVFTGGCNFRCPFCHNAALVLHPQDQPTVPEEEIFALLSKRHGLLDGVAVTGGEPTLQRDLPDFLRRVKEMGFAVKLDTNGTRPAMLRALAAEGLVDYVAMDVKNSWARYGETAGLPGMDLGPIRESAAFLLEGSVEYEFRTTVVKEFHRVSDIEDVARALAGAQRYFLQAFKDSGELIGGELSGCSREEMEAMRAAALPYIPATELRGID